MNVKSALLLALLLCTALVAPVIRAQDDGEDVDIDIDTEVDAEDVLESAEDVIEDYLGPSKHVGTNIVFPYHKNLEFPAGSIITAYVGVQNEGDAPITVTEIKSAIRSPMEYQQIFQNLTVQPLDTVIDAGNQATFLYRFRPSIRFEPRTFAFDVEIHYEDEESVFIDAPYNSTIELVDPESVGSQAVLAYVVLAGFVVLGAVLYRNQQQKSTSSKFVETGTGNDQDDDDWLADTHAKETPRKRTRSKRSDSSD